MFYLEFDLDFVNLEEEEGLEEIVEGGGSKSITMEADKGQVLVALQAASVIMHPFRQTIWGDIENT